MGRIYGWGEAVEGGGTPGGGGGATLRRPTAKWKTVRRVGTPGLQLKEKIVVVGAAVPAPR